MKILAVVDIWVAVFVHELPTSFAGRERTPFKDIKSLPIGINNLRNRGMQPNWLMVHERLEPDAEPYPRNAATWVKFSDLTDIVQSFTYDDDIRKEMQELMFTASVDRQAAAISKAQATAAPRVAAVVQARMHTGDYPAPAWRKTLVDDFAETQRNDTSQRLSEKHFDQMSEAWSAAVRAKVGAPSVHKSPPRQVPVTLSYSEDDE